MKDSRLTHSAITCVLGLTIYCAADIYCFNPHIEAGMSVYSNDFTCILVSSDFCFARIYEMDSDHLHPVLSREYWRGDFHLQHIKDGFYSISNKELPGMKCLENMDVSYFPSDSEYVSVKLKLGNGTDRYVVLAKSIRSDSIFKMVYPVEKEMQLPIDDKGYQFSIMPEGSSCISIAGITYGFSPTLKYLNLYDINKDFFASGGCIEISLPSFDDEVFDLWCINGDIFKINHQILNDYILWNGKQFKLYDGHSTIFNF